MEKKLTRQIGYQKNTSKKRVEKITPEEKIKSKLSPEIKEAVQTATVAQVNLLGVLQIQKEKSKKIVIWINKRPDFKWSSMCRNLKIDKSNFYRILNASDPEIKLEHISIIEEYLKLYGYAE